jgi:cell pole-organizing protein PopZ
MLVGGYEGAGNTLEGLVREMLKPMLRAWLDENLPRIVEDMVEREVARIAARGGRK